MVTAVARGGVIVFDCGTAPVTIMMTATAKVRNTSSTVVLDGGGRVTLSGGDKRRILYMNTCDEARTWTTSHCNDQATPQLTVQNLTFAKGNSTGETGEGGSGAIYLDGSTFTLTLDGTVIRDNQAAEGGGAIFFVSNDRTGTLRIRNSKLLDNPSAGFETAGLPGIFYLGPGKPSISRSTLKK